MLTYIHNFSNWKNYKTEGYLVENVDAAKSFMVKRLAREQEIAPADLTEEDKKKALENKQFLEIMELTKDMTGYALPMVKFHFNQEIPIGFRNEINNFDPEKFFGDDEQNQREISSISQLLGWLKTRKVLIERLPMSVDQYASRPTEQGQITGFESLADAIRTVELNQKGKYFIDRLTDKYKKQFKQLSPEKQQALYDIGNSFRKFDMEAAKIGTIKEKFPSNVFLKKIRAYEQEVDIEGFILKAQTNLKALNDASYQKIIEKIRSLSPQVGIVYDEPPYLVLSCRTEQAQKDLCSIANWCINRGHWGSYAGSQSDPGLQINIFNLDLPVSDVYYLTGTTIKYDGRVTASHDKNDGNIIHQGSRKSIYDHFRGLGYPEDLCKTLEYVIPIEIMTKKTLEKIKAIGKRSGDLDKNNSLGRALWDVAGQKLGGNISQEEWNGILGVITQVLESENGQLLNSLKQVYLKSGVHSLASLSIFKEFILPRLKQDEKIEILESTDKVFALINKAKERFGENLQNKQSTGESDENRQRVETVIALAKDEDEVKDSVRRSVGL